MSVDIRGYRPADHAACRDLWAEMTRSHWRDYDDEPVGGADPGAGFEDYMTKLNLSGVWVAVGDGDRVVGMTGLLIHGRHGEIDPIVVTEKLRENGIGTELIEKVTAEAEQRRLEYLSVRPAARNLAGLTCVHDAGFTTMTHVTLVKDLRPGKRDTREGVRLHGLDFRS